MQDVKPGYYWVRMRGTEWTPAEVENWQPHADRPPKLFVKMLGEDEAWEIGTPLEVEVGPALVPPDEVAPRSDATSDVVEARAVAFREAAAMAEEEAETCSEDPYQAMTAFARRLRAAAEKG